MSQNSDKIDPGAIILLRNKSNKKQHKIKEKKERHQKSSIKQYKKSIEKCKEFGIGIFFFFFVTYFLVYFSCKIIIQYKYTTYSVQICTAYF